MAVSFDHERGRYCVELPMTTRQMAEKEAAAKSKRTQGATTQGETKVTTCKRRNVRGFGCWYQRWYCTILVPLLVFLLPFRTEGLLLYCSVASHSNLGDSNLIYLHATLIPRWCRRRRRPARTKCSRSIFGPSV